MLAVLTYTSARTEKRVHSHSSAVSRVYLIIPVFCGAIKDDPDGRPVVENLFNTFDDKLLPDDVNQPTLNRANKFLEEELKLGRVAQALTVRQVYQEMKRFNTSSTRCWDIYAKTAHGSKASKGAITVDERVVLDSAKQRLFARCAPPVKAEVEKVLTQRKKDIKAVAKPQLDGRAGLPANSGTQQSVNLWTTAHVEAWLVANGMQRHVAKFAKAEVSGDILVELTLEDLEEEFGLGRMHAKAVVRKRDRLIDAVGAGEDEMEP